MLDQILIRIFLLGEKIHGWIMIWQDKRAEIYGVPASKWKSLKNRRLQNWGGVVHEKGLLPQNLPPWLVEITRRICNWTGLFPSPINHVLINEYLSNQGIMPHQDGPAYFPIVAILSLGSPAVMNFTPHLKLTECVTHVPDQIDKHCTLSVALIPCSLLIFKDSAYSEYLHGIDDSDIQRIDEVVNIGDILSYKEQMMPLSSELEEGDQRTEKGSIHRSGTRVSLTCRLVPKVHKNLLKF
ncbi:alpha-ketoglutarate-dependent dioxygenase alkB homolog 6 isoform X6 [Amborella trichopoda]|uniref:alpha-ketoglutarate-dependent dioxygenase alkB homolog 6 isoform X6 n=1 Tax=Amborella trichopoda TaxID=13333 RepID=UPI0009C17C98|nr:alpha-ketoglutarate-dependent dioxygenase alkB homolog 6 isoform X6 [Amborella trichopoda]|eukprot:XP_020517586.1 alpha-ketoglutarate-dependent dioxygenase alkB homolog 6 isoform X6 [Amborella trichopoda]